MQAVFHERDKEKLLIGIHLCFYGRRNSGLSMTKVKADGCGNVMKFCPLHDTYKGQLQEGAHCFPLGLGLSSRGAAFSPTALQHHLAQGTWPFYTFLIDYFGNR